MVLALWKVEDPEICVDTHFSIQMGYYSIIRFAEKFSSSWKSHYQRGRDWRKQEEKRDGWCTPHCFPTELGGGRILSPQLCGEYLDHIFTWQIVRWGFPCGSPIRAPAVFGFYSVLWKMHSHCYYMEISCSYFYLWNVLCIQYQVQQAEKQFLWLLVLTPCYYRETLPSRVLLAWQLL